MPGLSDLRLLGEDRRRHARRPLPEDKPRPPGILRRQQHRRHNEPPDQRRRHRRELLQRKHSHVHLVGYHGRRIRRHDGLHLPLARGGRRPPDGGGIRPHVHTDQEVPEVLQEAAGGPGRHERARGGGLLRPRHREGLRRGGGFRPEVRGDQRTPPLERVPRPLHNEPHAADPEPHKQHGLRDRLHIRFHDGHRRQHRVRDHRGVHSVREPVHEADPHDLRVPDLHAVGGRRLRTRVRIPGCAGDEGRRSYTASP